MNIGVNFFGPKVRLYHDFDGTLDALKASGITSAEVCLAFGGSEPPPHFPPELSGGIWPVNVAAQRIRAVREHGLAVVSAHIMLMNPEPEELVELIPALTDFGRENQIAHFVISLSKGLADMKRYAPALAELSNALAAAGTPLAYHNHEAECATEAGTTALDYILAQCPALQLELDVGWAKFAGANPVELMRRHRERLALLHFKDIRADASPATRDTCFTAVGEGSIPLSDILAEAQNCPIAEHGLIVDQDDSQTDILLDLAAGAANIRSAAPQ